jgi:hypothetical protein
MAAKTKPIEKGIKITVGLGHKKGEETKEDEKYEDSSMK